jgi:hypothetical protein
MSPAVFNLLKPSAVAEMISERYFWRDNVRISDRKVSCAADDNPVLRRLINAVFFLSDESRESATW